MNMAGVPTNTSKGLYIFCYVSLISSAKLDQNTKLLILLRNQIYCSKYRISLREEITHARKSKGPWRLSRVQWTGSVCLCAWLVKWNFGGGGSRPWFILSLNDNSFFFFWFCWIPVAIIGTRTKKLHMNRLDSTLMSNTIFKFTQSWTTLLHTQTWPVPMNSAQGDHSGG